MTRRAPFEIGGKRIGAGERRTVDLPVSVLSDHTPMNMSVHVIHGTRKGPTMFVSAAIHGDEIIGVEIVRRLLNSPNLSTLRGTLMVVPIVNAFGFLNHSRYLPDRRDLNRSFPGISHGSLAARLADHFMTHVVRRSDLGIDLHSAAVHRTNLPQVRVSPDDGETLRLAEAFGAPAVLVSGLRPKSLRSVAREAGIPVLLYEGGEALRFDEMSVRAGVSGILRVMNRMGMIAAKGVPKARAKPVICGDSAWQRAPAGGLIRTYRSEGDFVEPGEVMAIISDPFGVSETEVCADHAGIIIGRTLMPVVNEGDALFHVAGVKSAGDAEGALENLLAQLQETVLWDEDEII